MKWKVLEKMPSESLDIILGECPTYYSTKLLAKGKRVSAIAALSLEGAMDVLFVHGSDGDTFANFTERSLVPHLLPFDGIDRKCCSNG